MILCSRVIIIFINMFTVYASLICFNTCILNLCVHLILCGSPSIICPCFNASLPSLIYSSTLILRSISQLAFHLPAPTLHCGHSQQSSNLLRLSTACIVYYPKFLPCTVDISGHFFVHVLWHLPRFVAACLLSCSPGIWGRCARVRGI